MALVVNSGEPVTKAFYMVFDVNANPKFNSRLQAQQHVASMASKGSKFHRRAVDAIMETRMNAGASKKTRKK